MGRDDGQASADARYGLTISPTFDPLHRDTVSSQVRRRLTDAIHTGELAPGSPLPAERALCQEFGVARTSVREAIQGLVIAGFVERRGNRSVVSERLPDLHLVGSSSPEMARQVLELRGAIEPAIAELAARRATTEQRAEIAEIVARPVSSMGELRRLDVQLHEALARACANPLLTEVHAKAMALLRGDLLEMTQPTPEGDGAALVAAGEAACRAIADAVLAGDGRRAAVAQAAHVDRMTRRLNPPD
ncbi:MAG: putative GntR family transcriptional regulator [Ilumatobacteraceae bacterium]|nr:putative GntR family transcriptional regulator [Ilumatobacteraceae bacterium]